jgi:hypothetical protein
MSGAGPGSVKNAVAGANAVRRPHVIAVVAGLNERVGRSRSSQTPRQTLPGNTIEITDAGGHNASPITCQGLPQVRSAAYRLQIKRDLKRRAAIVAVMGISRKFI